MKLLKLDHRDKGKGIKVPLGPEFWNSIFLHFRK